MLTQAAALPPRERPVIFSGPGVRGILAGLKTQTRRVVREHLPDAPIVFAGWPCDADPPHPGSMRRCSAPPAGTFHVHFGPDHFATLRCPYGLPGDRLWVRERWGVAEGGCAFQATDGWEDDLPDATREALDDGRWRSPIYLPRALSRLVLEVTGVRVERLQAVTEADARAEGALPEFEVDVATFVHGRGPLRVEHRLGFKHGWDALHRGKVGEAWKDDPWVWVVTFQRLP